MASRWAETLPRVTIGRAVPKPVTLIWPYYQNAQFLQEQARHWQDCPDEVRPFISVIVVDDGSPERAVLPNEAPFPVALFRILQDIPWNWLAARNIGAYHAADGWMLLTDMDHVIPAETFRSLVEGAHDPSVVYVFARREHTGAVIQPHSASFLMTRQMFWRIGGYDEALSGHYGSDGDFRRRIATVAPMQVLPDYLVRYENVGDSSTTRYQRKLPADTTAVQQIVKARGPQWAPKTLSFTYERVLC